MMYPSGTSVLAFSSKSGAAVTFLSENITFDTIKKNLKQDSLSNIRNKDSLSNIQNTHTTEAG